MKRKFNRNTYFDDLPDDYFDFEQIKKRKKKFKSKYYDDKD